MRKSTIVTMTSRVLAAIASVSLCATLAACGSSDNTSKSSDKSSSDSSQSSSSSSSSALKNMKQIPGLNVSGELGKKPTITFATPKTVDNNSYAIVQKGDGEVIGDKDRVCAQAVALSAKDGSELMSTWEKNTPDCSLDMSSSDVSDAYREMIVGQKLNTTIAIGVNDSNSSGTSYIMALTLVSKTTDGTRATGDTVTDIPADLPKVTLGKNGKPSIDMNGYTGSNSLVAQPLIKGKGAEVQESNTVKVQYTGWLLDGTQFDSSWDKGTPISFSLSQVVKGWTQGLTGQTVGSQVLLVVPPDLGYGNQASGSIPANSTLVFVVDILAAY